MGRNVDVNTNVLLDSGTTISYFTRSIARSILYAIGAQVHLTLLVIKFMLLIVKLQVPLISNLIITSRSPFLFLNSFSKHITLSGKPFPKCEVRVRESEDNILGDNF